MEVLTTKKSENYELLDSGGEQKLERYGQVVLSRPENQALWDKKSSEEEWNKADAVFSHGQKSGRWTKKSSTPHEWKINFEGFVFNLKLLPSKHLGLFPEQLENWKWLEQKIRSFIKPEQGVGNNLSEAQATTVKVLNLFAHTGGATLACSRVGAEVVHLDASKYAVDIAKKNLEDSGMKNNKVRFVVDDVRKFIEREIKRGVKYDVIVLDPPVYGKGTNDKVWKIEDDLVPLLHRVKKLLSDKPLCILLNGYASIYSSISYEQVLSSVFDDIGGDFSNGSLAIQETSKSRVLPCGIYARWERS